MFRGFFSIGAARAYQAIAWSILCLLEFTRDSWDQHEHLLKSMLGCQ